MLRFSLAAVLTILAIACGPNRNYDISTGDLCNADASTCGAGLQCLVVDVPAKGPDEYRCSTTCKTDDDCKNITCPASSVVTCGVGSAQVAICSCTPL